MRLTESQLRKLTRSILLELLTKSEGLFDIMTGRQDTGSRGGSGGYGDYYGDYGDDSDSDDDGDGDGDGGDGGDGGGE